MGRAEKFALIQSQLLLCGLVAVLAYLLATEVSAALAAFVVASLVVLYAWIFWRVAGDNRRRFS